ncbi:gem (nuclear organelle) associated protein 2 [Nowakowskiella sp. JEL0078]|nr:gem (nuclear organelle) associated protein 2 [Nowakowskiella sp. JEL0078]
MYKRTPDFDETGLIRQALPLDDDVVDQINPDPNGPPVSGYQYLRAVREQASKYAPIAVANFSYKQLVQPQKIPSVISDEFIEWRKEFFTAERKPDISLDFLPTESWSHQFLHEFRSFKENSMILSHHKRSLNSSSEYPPRGDSKRWTKCCAEEPDFEKISLIDQPTVLYLLQMHLTWIPEDDISESQGKWLVLLFMKLDPLLTGDDVSLVREVCRRMKCIRQALSDPTDLRISILNMVITLVSKSFGQKDLSDEAIPTKGGVKVVFAPNFLVPRKLEILKSTQRKKKKNNSISHRAHAQKKLALKKEITHDLKKHRDVEEGEEGEIEDIEDGELVE